MNFPARGRFRSPASFFCQRPVAGVMLSAGVPPRRRPTRWVGPGRGRGKGKAVSDPCPLLTSLQTSGTQLCHVACKCGQPPIFLSQHSRLRTRPRRNNTQLSRSNSLGSHVQPPPCICFLHRRRPAQEFRFDLRTISPHLQLTRATSSALPPRREHGSEPSSIGYPLVLHCFNAWPALTTTMLFTTTAMIRPLYRYASTPFFKRSALF